MGWVRLVLVVAIVSNPWTPASETLGHPWALMGHQCVKQSKLCPLLKQVIIAHWFW